MVKRTTTVQGSSSPSATTSVSPTDGRTDNPSIAKVEAMIRNGLTRDLGCQRLFELMNATIESDDKEWKDKKRVPVIVPDKATRLKATELYFRLNGDIRPESNNIQVAVLNKDFEDALDRAD